MPLPAFIIPAAALLANTVIPIVADKLFPKPRLQLADRLATKRRELFDLGNSTAQQNFVDVGEILGDQIASTSRGGATSASGDLREIQRNVNRAADLSFRASAETFGAGTIEDERTQILADHDEAVASRENSLRAVGSGLQLANQFAALSSRTNAIRSLMNEGGDRIAPQFENFVANQALSVTSGINDTNFLNLDFETTTPNIDGLGIQAALPSAIPEVESLDSLLERRLMNSKLPAPPAFSGLFT